MNTSTTLLAADPRVLPSVPAPALPPGATTTEGCDCWPRPGVLAPINDPTGVNCCDACQGHGGSDLEATRILAELVGGTVRFYVGDTGDPYPYGDEEYAAWLRRREIATYTGPTDCRFIAGRTDPWVEIGGHPLDWTPLQAADDTPEGRIARFLAGINARGPEILRGEILTIAGAATGHRNVTLHTADVHAVLDKLDQLSRGTEVHTVQRDNLDGLYLFTDPDQAAAYAGQHPGAETGTARIIDPALGERMLVETAAETATASEVEGETPRSADGHALTDDPARGSAPLNAPWPRPWLRLGRRALCGHTVGASHPCAEQDGHSDLHACGEGDCSWGSYTLPRSRRTVLTAVPRSWMTRRVGRWIRRGER